MTLRGYSGSADQLPSLFVLGAVVPVLHVRGEIGKN